MNMLSNFGNEWCIFYKKKKCSKFKSIVEQLFSLVFYVYQRTLVTQWNESKFMEEQDH
jgi:hypothetical protein